MPVHPRQPFFSAVTAIVLVGSLAGCSSRPVRVPAPRIDPEAIVAAVFELADADRDGSLRAAEQQTVPAIAAAAGRFDTDGDGGVAREELRAWLEAVSDSRVAINPLELVVWQRGRPLVGATVRLVPEPFMGEQVKAAEGVTDADGTATMTISDTKYPGVNCGLYRVQLADAVTSLGVAVGAGVPETGLVQLAID